MLRTVVQFLRAEKEGKLIEEGKVESQPAGSKLIGSINEPVSLAALNYLFDKKGTEIKTKEKERISFDELAELLQVTQGVDLSGYQKIIRSGIEGQDKTQRAWVRELIQNARDAIRRAREEGKLEVTLGSVTITNFIDSDDPDKWVFSIRDQGVGMDIWHLIRYFFPLDQSSKDYLTDTGNLGQGNYTLYADFDSVFIRTSTGNGIFNEITIERTAAGPVITKWEVYSGAYQGTEIRRIKTQENSDPQLESLFIQEGLEKFAGAIQSPEDKKKAGLEPDIRDVEITYNNDSFSEKITETANSDLGGGYGEITISRAEKRYQKRVIQDGLFIKYPNGKELSLVPKWIQLAFERFGGTHISISRNIKPNIPRTGYSEEHKYLNRLQMAVLHNIAKTILRDFGDGKTKIPGMPPEYFSNEITRDSREGKFYASILANGIINIGSFSDDEITALLREGLIEVHDYINLEENDKERLVQKDYLDRKSASQGRFYTWRVDSDEAWKELLPKANISSSLETKASEARNFSRDTKYDVLSEKMMENIISDPIRFFEFLSHIPYQSKGHNGEASLSEIREAFMQESRVRQARKKARKSSEIFAGRENNLRGEFGRQVIDAAGHEIANGNLGGMLARKYEGSVSKNNDPDEIWKTLPPKAKEIFTKFNKLFLDIITNGDSPEINYFNNEKAPARAQAGGMRIEWNLAIVKYEIASLLEMLSDITVAKEGLSENLENTFWSLLQTLVHESQHLVIFEEPGDHTHHDAEKIDGTEGITDRRFGVRMGEAIDRILSYFTDNNIDLATSLSELAEDKAMLSLENIGKRELNKLEGNFGFLPSDNPIQQYIDNLIARLFPDEKPEDLPKFLVLGSLGMGINAFMFSNDIGVITPEMIKSVNNEEELIFVIFHELIHSYREHIKKKTDLLEETQGIRPHLGLNRYQEYEADIGAFWMMNDKGVNNLGALTYSERMHRTKNGWDFTHGTNTDRFLNLQTITYIADLPNLSSELLNPIPEEVKEGINTLNIGGKLSAIINSGYSSNEFFQRQIYIDNANIYLLQSAIPEIYNRILRIKEQIKRNHGTIKTSEEGKLLSERKIMELLERRLSKILDEKLAGLSAEVKTILRYFILNVNFETPLNQESSGVKKIDDTFKRFRDIFIDINIFDKIESALKSSIYNDIGLTFSTQKLEEFIINCLNYALAEDIFTDDKGHFDYAQYFNRAKSFYDFAKEYANSRGNETELSQPALWTNILFSAVETLFMNETSDKARESLPAMIDYFTAQSFPDISFYLFKSLLATSEIDKKDTKFLSDFMYSRKTEIDKATSLHNITIPEAKDDIVRIINDSWPQIKRLDKELFKSSHDTSATDPIKAAEKREHLSAQKRSVDKAFKESILRALKGYSLEDIIKVILYIKDLTNTGVSDRDALNEIIRIIENNILNSIDSFESLVNTIQFYQIISDNVYIANGDIQRLLSFEIPNYSYGDPFSAQETFNFSLTLKDMEHLRIVISDISIAEERFGVKSLIKDKPTDPEEWEEFKVLLFYSLYKDLEAANDTEQFFSIISSYLAKYHLPGISELSIPEANDGITMKCFELILKKGLSFVSLTSKEPENSERLILLSYFIQDIHIRNYLQEYLFMERIRGASFNAAIDYIFNLYPKNRSAAFAKAIEYLIEEKAEKVAGKEEENDFEVIKRHIKDIYEISAKDNMNFLGNFVGMDYFMEKVFRNKEKLLSLLLGTARDDRPMKEYLLSIWFPVHEDTIIDQDSNLDFGDEDNNSGQGNYYPLDFILSHIYRLDTKGRYVLLRKLLMGNKGILTKEKSRLTFLDDFITKYVEADDPAVMEIINEIMTEIATEASDDKLYFPLSSLLLDRIALPPKESSSWKTIADDFVENNYKDLAADEKTKLKKRLLHFILGYDPENNDTASVAEEFLQVLPPDYISREFSTMTTMNFTLQMAKSFRTPGVRFLQMLGQFVQIPDEFRQEFMQIYDSVKGQSRLSAYETIKREIPEYFQQIKIFGKRIGGGSMVTVYEVELIDGAKEVVRVLNPNVKFDMNSTIELLRNILTNLEELDEKYDKLMPLLDDLRAWIEGELNDLSYFADDAEFHKKNNGYQPKGFKYSIFVPENKGGSAKVKREAFVEGKTLTTFKASSAEEKKEITSLIIRNYFDQIRGSITDLTKLTLVHSDAHKGNFIVTPNNKIAIIDRNFYIKLSIKDRLFLRTLLDEEPIKDKIERFIKFLLEQQENQELKNRYSNKDDISYLAERMASGIDSAEIESNILRIMVDLRKSGFFIPLRISLLIKNLNSLNQMAKESGFESIIEAKDYRPDKAMLSSEEKERLGKLRYSLMYGSPDERAIAARKLGENGDSEDLVRLTDKLNDPNLNVRINSAYALGQMARLYDEPLETLINQLINKDPEIKKAAENTLLFFANENTKNREKLLQKLDIIAKEINVRKEKILDIEDLDLIREIISFRYKIPAFMIAPAERLLKNIPAKSLVKSRNINVSLYPEDTKQRSFLLEATALWAIWNNQHDLSQPRLPEAIRTLRESGFIVRNGFENEMLYAASESDKLVPPLKRYKIVDLLAKLTENVYQHGFKYGIAVIKYDPQENKAYVAVMDTGRGFHTDETGVPQISNPYTKTFVQRPGSPGRSAALRIASQLSEKLMILTHGHLWDRENLSLTKIPDLSGIEGSLVFSVIDLTKDTAMFSERNFEYTPGTQVDDELIADKKPGSLLYNGKTLSWLGAGRNNDIFNLNDPELIKELIEALPGLSDAQKETIMGSGLIVRIDKGYRGKYSPDMFELINNLADNGLVPRILNEGYLRDNTGKEYHFIISERVIGTDLTLLTNNIEPEDFNLDADIKPLSDENIDLFTQLVLGFIDANLYFSDFFKTSNIMIGKINPNDSNRAWFVDYDQIEEFPNADRIELINNYLEDLATWDEWKKIDPKGKIRKALLDLKSGKKPADLGGIDLTNDKLNIKTHGDNPQINVNFDENMLKGINGFVPVIIDIKPINSLPLLLGETSEKDFEELASK